MYLAYCDDEPVQLEYIRMLAEKWAALAGMELTFSSYLSGDELLFANEEGYPFDIVILDIDMKGTDGMSLARKIRKEDTRVPIIFLTNRKEFVFEGYEVKAMRYLLKPVDEEKLFPLLYEIKTEQKKEKHYLIETVGGERVKIELEDILYLESAGHYVTIHTQSESYQILKSLAELEKQIRTAAPGESGFIRTHRSFLVNLYHVEKVLRTECILSDQSKIPISRNCYHSVNQAFIAYYIT